MEKTFYIIDDHEMLRLGTISYIENNSDWKSLGSANNEEKTFSDLEKFSAENNLPYILISDLNFYGKDSGFNLIKKIGAVPRNKPIVVIPNANPGLFFNLDTIIPRVIAIVIEKNITPIKDIIIMLSPKHKKGIANSVDAIATFLIPNTSDNIPPNAFPIPIVTKNIIV